MSNINDIEEIQVKPKVLYFDTDDDFYKFCVEPKLIVKTCKNYNGDDVCCTTFDFTPAYNDELSNNTIFVMRDKNSQIIKHDNVVSYRTISKKVKNLMPWYYEKIFECDK